MKYKPRTGKEIMEKLQRDAARYVELRSRRDVASDSLTLEERKELLKLRAGVSLGRRIFAYN